MQNILLTIIGPSRKYDLELPGDVPIHSLIPLLVDICGPTPSSLPAKGADEWCLCVTENYRALNSSLSLSDAEIFDGSILHLQKVSALKEEPLPNKDFQPRSLTPGPETGGIGVQWDRNGLFS